MEFMMGQAVKQDVKVLLESKPKFLLVHSSSGHKQALKEVLSHPSVTVRLADTKVSEHLDAYSHTDTNLGEVFNLVN